MITNAVQANNSAMEARNLAVDKANALVGMTIANAIDHGSLKCKVKIGTLAVAMNVEETLRKNGYVTRLKTGHNAHFVSINWERPTVY